jgi:hypothetical protein
MNIRSPCTLDYVKIKSSRGGHETTLCGDQNMMEPIKTKPKESLIITFKTTDMDSDSSGKFYKGWKCKLRCVQPEKQSVSTQVQGVVVLPNGQSTGKLPNQNLADIYIYNSLIPSSPLQDATGSTRYQRTK